MHILKCAIVHIQCIIYLRGNSLCAMLYVMCYMYYIYGIICVTNYKHVYGVVNMRCMEKISNAWYLVDNPGTLHIAIIGCPRLHLNQVTKLVICPIELHRVKINQKKFWCNRKISRPPPFSREVPTPDKLYEKIIINSYGMSEALKYTYRCQTLIFLYY